MLAQEVVNGFEVDRLGEVKIEAGLARAAPVFVLAPSGQGDEQRNKAAGKHGTIDAPGSVRVEKLCTPNAAMRS